jgi:hypothetical protein
MPTYQMTLTLKIEFDADSEAKAVEIAHHLDDTLVEREREDAVIRQLSWEIDQIEWDSSKVFPEIVKRINLDEHDELFDRLEKEAGWVFAGTSEKSGG